ncbi:hypothetical protein NEOLEDRAFT_1075785 [Neolentinus lepideus HHB14362 ss-1]|uniref:Uncharacterized protein n=1 Tax=Neolentinus lepideus HHB14362 ss-1 TaxID=1314782 RepID=A0A165P1S5_9AGAM|nr:hypothetical protein NEOLEDRAFT_1075785 [Neolentinus lepideus HHB14362 ss-1]
MPFRARNLFYLRISKSDVIPLYLYLDERHIEWMSDRVLQHVLADLRPLIGPKMKAESQLTEGPSGKKGIVDVYRGDFYQFAYFFRGMEPHSVILKTRNFVAAPDRPKGQMLPSPSPEPARQSERGTKRKKSCASLKQKAKGKERARTRDINEDELEDFESEEDVISGDDDADYTPRHRSSRARRRPKRTTQEAIEVEDNFVDDADDTQMIEGTNQELIVKEETEDVLPATPAPDGHSQESSTTIVINVDEEESKPKPILQLRYKGFSISGRYLCVIVEPWPPIRSASRAPSLAPLQSTGLRRPSIAPPDFVPSTGLRERTPLFLPDDDRGETPAPFLNSRVLPPVPAFNDPAPDQSIEGYDESDMMAFSQVLHSAGDLRGIEVDDDDIDGAVLFGDADETREL